MKNLYLLFCLLFSSSIIFAQQSNAVSAFANSNPQISFINETTYASFTEEQLSLLDNEVIVFDQNLKVEDLSSNASFKSGLASLNREDKVDTTVSDIIKKWKSTHPEVKILKRSMYNSLSANEQTTYVNFGAMILIGETLTIQDINNY